MPYISGLFHINDRKAIGDIYGHTGVVYIFCNGLKIRSYIYHEWCVLSVLSHVIVIALTCCRVVYVYM